MDEVPCTVVTEDDLTAELAMIDENLMRSELSPAERAKGTARRKAIYLELHPETAPGGDRRGNQMDKLSTCSFADSTAAVIGKDARSVRRDAERGKRISEPALTLVSGTQLDAGKYLDTLKRVPKPEQVERVQRDLAARPAPPAPIDPDAAYRAWIEEGQRWLNRGSPEWQALARTNLSLAERARMMVRRKAIYEEK